MKQKLCVVIILCIVLTLPVYALTDDQFSNEIHQSSADVVKIAQENPELAIKHWKEFTDEQKEQLYQEPELFSNPDVSKKFFEEKKIDPSSDFTKGDVSYDGEKLVNGESSIKLSAVEGLKVVSTENGFCIETCEEGVKLSGETKADTISYDTEKKTLTLNNEGKDTIVHGAKDVGFTSKGLTVDSMPIDGVKEVTVEHQGKSTLYSLTTSQDEAIHVKLPNQGKFSYEGGKLTAGKDSVVQWPGYKQAVQVFDTTTFQKMGEGDYITGKFGMSFSDAGKDFTTFNKWASSDMSLCIKCGMPVEESGLVWDGKTLTGQGRVGALIRDSTHTEQAVMVAGGMKGVQFQSDGSSKVNLLKIPDAQTSKDNYKLDLEREKTKINGKLTSTPNMPTDQEKILQNKIKEIDDHIKLVDKDKDFYSTQPLVHIANFDGNRVDFSYLGQKVSDGEVVLKTYKATVAAADAPQSSFKRFDYQIEGKTDYVLSGSDTYDLSHVEPAQYQNMLVNPASGEASVLEAQALLNVGLRQDGITLSGNINRLAYESILATNPSTPLNPNDFNAYVELAQINYDMQDGKVQGVSLTSNIGEAKFPVFDSGRATGKQIAKVFTLGYADSVPQTYQSKIASQLKYQIAGNDPTALASTFTPYLEQIGMGGLADNLETTAGSIKIDFDSIKSMNYFKGMSIQMERQGEGATASVIIQSEEEDYVTTATLPDIRDDHGENSLDKSYAFHLKMLQQDSIAEMFDSTVQEYKNMQNN